MQKVYTYCCLSFLLIAFNSVVFAQQIIVSGLVTEQRTGNIIPDVSVIVKGTLTAQKTNNAGRFSISIPQKLPVILVFSHIGYGALEREIISSERNIAIVLEPKAILGQEVVIAASQVPERILESPVSVERLGAVGVRETAAPSFYDALANMKGVELSIQSITFKSVNTRGFNSNGNVRLNQWVDGMDNQAPGLNFPVGNIVGLTDLDVESVELLPGASSALYGSGGTNGTLLMNSKSPFNYPGLSAYFKAGINHVDNRQAKASPWEDMAFRYARVVNKKFAFKLTASYLQARDWQGENYSNFNRIAREPKQGTRVSDPLFDGVNIYGDEPNTKYPTLNQIGALVKSRAPQVPAQFLPEPFKSIITAYEGGLLPNTSATRTGYAESDLVDYGAKSIKTSGALHYKLNNSIEAIAQANWGTGTSVYTGTDRYSLRNFNIGQYKLELRGDDFFIRGYTTQERSGRAYNATLLATLMNEGWKPSSTWFQEYTAAYASARLQGAEDAQAQGAARGFADRDRPTPNSPLFGTLKQKITEATIGPANGAKFNDKSNLYHYEGIYNFSGALDNAVDLIVGASYRVFDLNSGGTLFDDLNKDLTIKEYGAYTQLSRKLGEKLKLTGSVRFDKNENFEGRFTPRFAAVYAVAANNNIRASYQTGFRNPTNQDQYIDLAVGGGTIRLIGGLPSFIEKYKLGANPAYIAASYRELLATGNPAVLKTYSVNSNGIKPERVQAFELGYKGLFGDKLLLDTYGYYNIYNDYITSVEVYQNPTPESPAGIVNATRFNMPVNSTDRVTSWGAALGLDYVMNKFSLNGNVSYNELGKITADYLNDFNTPKVRFNLGFAGRRIVKNAGFGVNYRWQDSYFWQSTFAAGPVPAFGTVDAQVNFKLPLYNSMIKLGGSNLLNKYYYTSYGNPAIGGMYYISLIFDQTMR